MTPPSHARYLSGTVIIGLVLPLCRRDPALWVRFLYPDLKTAAALLYVVFVTTAFNYACLAWYVAPTKKRNHTKKRNEMKKEEEEEEENKLQQHRLDRAAFCWDS